MIITIDSTIDEVYIYLKEKLNINEEILKKIREEKIDGEALILLRKSDFKNLGINLRDRKRIKENIEKNILKMKKDIYSLKINHLKKTKKMNYLNIFKNI